MMTEIVKDMLLQFFSEELNSSSSRNVINSAEEWIESSTKCIEEVMHANNTVDDCNITTNLGTNTPENCNQNTDNLEDVSDKEFDELFRMKKTTAYDLQKEFSNSESIDKYLLICLWILGNTKSFTEIGLIFNVRQDFLFAVCENYFTKIIKLSEKYVMWPSLSEIMAVEKGFEVEYGFPGVVGVIGSLQIEVFVSENDPDANKYFNKNTKNYTIVLQFVCDNSLLFRDIFAGYPGSNSISTILKASPLYNRLIDENSSLVKTKKHLLGGTEHPQMCTLLTPYYIPKCREPTKQEIKFNMIHSLVMLTVEKTFRMVETRFPRMKSLDAVNPKFAALTAGTICTLHNFCRLRNDNYC